MPLAGSRAPRGAGGALRRAAPRTLQRQPKQPQQQGQRREKELLEGTEGRLSAVLELEQAAEGGTMRLCHLLGRARPGGQGGRCAAHLERACTTAVIFIPGLRWMAHGLRWMTHAPSSPFHNTIWMVIQVQTCRLASYRPARAAQPRGTPIGLLPTRPMAQPHGTPLGRLYKLKNC